jgi:ABC-type sugar transport system substrate-binding protein
MAGTLTATVFQDAVGQGTQAVLAANKTWTRTKIEEQTGRDVDLTMSLNETR